MKQYYGGLSDMKKIPYSLSDFEVIRRENYMYVDKTSYIEDLEKYNKIAMFFRPRRFGKSLLTTMLDAYYAIDKDSEFDTLFKGLYIYDHPTEKRNSYYILKFNFSGLTLNTGMPLDQQQNTFKEIVIRSIKEFSYRYSLPISLNYDSAPASILGDFMISFKGLGLKNKIYIIIDEYDSFINGLIKGNSNTYKKSLEDGGFIKAFYVEIKKATEQGVVDRFFATGVNPITRYEISDEFNITKDISLKKNFAAISGFTKEETKKVLDECLPESCGEAEKLEILEYIQKHYGGYKFCKDSNETLCNGNLVMYFLDELIEQGIAPDKVMDPNVMHDFSNIESSLELVNTNQKYDFLKELLEEESIKGQLVENYKSLSNSPKNNSIAILFYNGYLTYKDSDKFTSTFIVPNRIIRVYFAEYFSTLVKRKNSSEEK